MHVHQMLIRSPGTSTFVAENQWKVTHVLEITGPGQSHPFLARARRLQRPYTRRREVTPQSQPHHGSTDGGNSVTGPDRNPK
jgi:hypothetical protein